MKIKAYANAIHLRSFINKNASTLTLFHTKSDYASYEVEIDAGRYAIKMDSGSIVISYR